MLRSIFMVVSISLATVSVSALELSPSEALNRVLNGSDSRKPLSVGGRRQTPSLKHTVKSAEQNTIYIFDRNNNGGFLVVAADDVCESPLLGYTDSGEFSSEDMPDALKALLEQYSEEIAMASAGGVEEYTTTSESSAATDRVEIAPMMITKWYQTAPYNDLSPMINDKHTPTGCVATAMAQVMRYYNFPARGTGSVAYKSANIADSIKVNFAESVYDWANMPYAVNVNSNVAHKEAIAKLMYDCGVAAQSTYNSTVTSSNYAKAGRAMIDYFGYDPGMRLLYHTSFSEDEWNALIYNELANGRPVLYGGSNNAGGHAFVCDGYATGDYFHINWGWGGASDGYFRLSALDPKNQGVGGTGTTYNQGQHVLVGICPAKSKAGATLAQVYEMTGDYSTAKTSYVKSASTGVVFNTKLAARTLQKMTVTFGVKVEGASGTVEYIASAKTRTPTTNTSYSSTEVPSAGFPDDGVYTVSPAVRTADGEWHTDCFYFTPASNNSITLIANDGNLEFVKGPGQRVSVGELRIEGNINGKVLRVEE